MLQSLDNQSVDLHLDENGQIAVIQLFTPSPGDKVCTYVSVE